MEREWVRLVGFADTWAEGFTWDGEFPWDPDGKFVSKPDKDGRRSRALSWQDIHLEMVGWRNPGDEIRGGM